MIAEFQRSGVSPQISMQVTSAETTIDLAATGLGMGFVPENAHIPANVTLIHLQSFEVALKLRFAWQPKNLSPTLQQFIKLLDLSIEEETDKSRMHQASARK